MSIRKHWTATAFEIFMDEYFALGDAENGQAWYVYRDQFKVAWEWFNGLG